MERLKVCNRNTLTEFRSSNDCYLIIIFTCTQSRITAKALLLFVQF